MTKHKKAEFPISLDDATFSHRLPNAGRYALFCEMLTGRPVEGELPDREGVALSPHVVLARHRDGPFTLCLRLGGEWYALTEVANFDPVLMELRAKGAITATAESNGARAERQRREDERRRAAEAAEAERERRAEKLAQRKAEWERQRAEHEVHIRAHHGSAAA